LFNNVFFKENIEIEDVNRKMTHITIDKLKRTNNETLHSKLNIWQHELRVVFLVFQFIPLTYIETDADVIIIAHGV
jgi:hypothetical protein